MGSSALMMVFMKEQVDEVNKLHHPPALLVGCHSSFLTEPIIDRCDDNPEAKKARSMKLFQLCSSSKMNKRPLI